VLVQEGAQEQTPSKFKANTAWRCGETAVGYASADSGYASGSSGINDEDVTIIIRNPPPKEFVLELHTTAHAFSTWHAKLNGKWCDQDYSLIDDKEDNDDVEHYDALFATCRTNGPEPSKCKEAVDECVREYVQR
jgi:hypothetical protein